MTPSILAHLSLDATRAHDAEEREAFTAAVRPLEPGLVTLVWRLLGWPTQSAEIEDVLQEVMLTAWVQRAQLRDGAAFAGWLRRIAVNTTRNHARGMRRRRQRVELVDFGPGMEPDAIAHQGDDEQLQIALIALRHADRELLVLHYLEGHSPSDLAVMLGVNRNALEARLSRARKRLRTQLEHADHD